MQFWNKFFKAKACLFAGKYTLLLINTYPIGMSNNPEMSIAFLKILKKL